jgi:hypothetical protein
MNLSKIAEYEQNEQKAFNHLLYLSFSRQFESWVMNNYQVDHNLKMLSPNVHHYKQQSYLFFSDGQVYAGVTFNYNNSEELQLEKMGFTIPSPLRSHCCEMINFFIIEKPQRNPIKIGRSVRRLSDKKLRETNLSAIYATCLPRIFGYYTRFGWKQVDDLDSKTNRKLYLIQYSRQ